MAIYLDNSATTRPAESVIAAMDEAMRTHYFNASAAYGPAVEVEKRIDACRREILSALHAKNAQVVFTSGGTESDNLAILGTAQLQRKSMRFLYSAIEHPAVTQAMAEAARLGHDVREIPVTREGLLDLTALEGLLSEETALVSCMHVNNETGAIQPLGAIHELIRQHAPKALFHVDGVQGFLRSPLHFDALGIDFYAISAHKIHGPKGVGALVMRKGTRLKPQILGGGQENGQRSTTYNSPGIIGLGEAVRAYQALEAPQEKMRALKAQLYALLTQGDPAIVVNGPAPHSDSSAPHILNVSFPGVRGEVLLHALEGEGIYVSTGSACSSHKMKASGVLARMGITGDRAQGALRVSLSPYTTQDEINQCAQAMLACYAQLKPFRRR